MMGSSVPERAGRLLRRLLYLPAIPLLALAGCELGGSGVESTGFSLCRVTQPTRTLPEGLHETSGVALSQAHPGTLWLHNDSGHQPRIFAVDAAGRLQGRTTVTAAENQDWEDLAIGPCPTGDCLYIADIGDNGRVRQDVQLYRVPEPTPGDAATAPAERFTMRFPEGPRNAEAIFLLPPERLYVVTKGSDSRIEIFAYPGALQAEQTAVLQPVRALSDGRVSMPDLVTGAGANRTGDWVAIRTYTSVLLYPAEPLVGPGEITPLHVAIGAIGENQGEGVALGDNGALVLAGEGGGGGIPGTLGLLWCDLARVGATANADRAPQGGY